MKNKKYDKENPQFWSLDLEPYNVMDLNKWIDEGVLIGLVDEEEGGIIAYVHEKHINKFLKELNR